MKIAIAVLMLVAAAQAVDWDNVKRMERVRPSIIPHAPVNSGKIIGGSLATVGQFKYQVGVFMDGSYFCGGSQLTADTVLTAAHCVQGFASWRTHHGALNIRDESEAGRVMVTTTNARAHEDYGALFITNDIGLIFLGQSVSGPNIETVRLPGRGMAGNLFVGERVRVSGWGKPSDASPGISNDMKFVDVTVITNAECESYYGSISVRDSVICVGTAGGTESTCNGDSGGPLVFTEGDGMVSEIGVVSFGSSAGCESGAPAAFTRVTEYLDWLQTNGGIPIRP